MDHYRIGRKYTECGKDSKAKEFYEIGFSKGCSKCAYGLFALKMSRGLDARVEWENFVNMLPDIEERAENGDADSCFIMGRCFETGCGGISDMQKAICWYEKAMELGNVDAAFNLGCIYCYDETITDMEKGVTYFKCAASSNLKEAQFNLAHMYELMGNNGAALFWYKRARRGGTAEMKEKYMQICSAVCEKSEKDL